MEQKVRVKYQLRERLTHGRKIKSLIKGWGENRRVHTSLIEGSQNLGTARDALSYRDWSKTTWLVSGVEGVALHSKGDSNPSHHQPGIDRTSAFTKDGPESCELCQTFRREYVEESVTGV